MLLIYRLPQNLTVAFFHHCHYSVSWHLPSLFVGMVGEKTWLVTNEATKKQNKDNVVERGLSVLYTVYRLSWKLALVFMVAENIIMQCIKIQNQVMMICSCQCTVIEPSPCIYQLIDVSLALILSCAFHWCIHHVNEHFILFNINLFGFEIRTIVAYPWVCHLPYAVCSQIMRFNLLMHCILLFSLVNLDYIEPTNWNTIRSINRSAFCKFNLHRVKTN